MWRTSPLLIVVTGLPCSGKSMLAAELRERSGWPLLAKDAFKETLFATLGIRDRDWSRRLSQASYALMFRMADELLGRGQSLILEGNFRAADHDDTFARLLAQRPVETVQILCSAEPAVLRQRLQERASRGQRHPGHRDQETLAELEAEAAAGPFRPLALQGPCLQWDSSHPDAQSLAALLAGVTRDPAFQRASTSSTSV